MFAAFSSLVSKLVDLAPVAPVGFRPENQGKLKLQEAAKATEAVFRRIYGY